MTHLCSDRVADFDLALPEELGDLATQVPTTGRIARARERIVLLELPVCCCSPPAHTSEEQPMVSGCVKGGQVHGRAAAESALQLGISVSRDELGPWGQAVDKGNRAREATNPGDEVRDQRVDNNVVEKSALLVSVVRCQASQICSLGAREGTREETCEGML